MANEAKGPGAETLLTRYLIYKTADGGETLALQGESLARGSEQALRSFFQEPLRDNDGTFVAISENHCKLRKVEARVRTSVGDGGEIAIGQQATLV